MFMLVFMYLVILRTCLRCYCSLLSVDEIFNQWFHSFQIDNEENALVCLRIIIELNKQFRPVFTSEVSIQTLRLYFFALVIITMLIYDSGDFFLLQCATTKIQCFEAITFQSRVEDPDICGLAIPEMHLPLH